MVVPTAAKNVGVVVISLLAGALLSRIISPSTDGGAQGDVPVATIERAATTTISTPVAGSGPRSTKLTKTAPVEANLEEERRLRMALSENVASLELRLEEANAARLEAERALADLRSRNRRGPSVEVEPDPAELAAEVEDEAEDGEERPAPWFDRDALLGACGSSSTVAEIEARWEQFEMDKLYLADEAQRLGYIRKPKYKRKLVKLELELRNEYGPEGYDAFLYAVGKPNRVAVSHVLASSPAGLAGVMKGDVVIRYDGERVFFPYEFKKATSRGEPEDLVLLDVMRDGEEVNLRVPRGPLGIQMLERGDPPLSCY
jgi:hypothetical protein